MCGSLSCQCDFCERAIDSSVGEPACSCKGRCLLAATTQLTPTGSAVADPPIVWQSVKLLRLFYSDKLREDA
jgi:hypothetical protein